MAIAPTVKDSDMRNKKTVTIELDIDLYDKVSVLASANGMKVKHFIRRCLAQSAAAPPTLEMLNRPNITKESVEVLLSAFNDCAVLGNINRWIDYNEYDRNEVQDYIYELCKWVDYPLIHI